MGADLWPRIGCAKFGLYAIGTPPIVVAAHPEGSAPVGAMPKMATIPHTRKCGHLGSLRRGKMAKAAKMASGQVISVVNLP